MIDEIAAAIAGAPKAQRSKKKPVKSSEGQAKKRQCLKNYTLPDNCPVVPLGTNDGNFFYIDSNRQLRTLPAGKHNRLELMALFGDKAALLTEYWPRMDRDGTIEGWRPEMAAQALMEACSAKGVLDLYEAVRGPGCWQDQAGSLVMHCGDIVYQGHEKLQPGKIGEFVYPAAAPKPRPTEAAGCADAGRELLALLRTWSWRRPEIDPVLLLGWIGAAMLGGALDWRPLVWITGDKGTGKSTLHKLLKSVFGPGGLISASDASAAGLWQAVGHASLPVGLDETEAEEDNRRGHSLIKLARHAASGGSVLRGGSDHRHSDFTVRSCFLFSSILVPPLLGQDVSRMAILQLNRIENVQPPCIDTGALENIGASFRYHLLTQWQRLPETLARYRNMLNEAGHGGRGADQFGTLLACHDLLLFDTSPDSDTLSEWAEKLKATDLEETQDDVADHERCLVHLLTSIVDVYRHGSRKSIGQWLQEAAGHKHGDLTEANNVLSTFGMKIRTEDTKRFLQVAHYHQGLAKLFEGTQWGGRSGSTGVWAQAFRRIDGAQSRAGIRFNGVKSRCVEVPIEQIISRGDE